MEIGPSAAASEGQVTGSNACYKYDGYQVLATGVVSQYSVFSAKVRAGFSSLAGVRVGASLTLVFQYNFRFLLAPSKVNEGPSWDQENDRWVIPWKDDNGDDKVDVSPTVDAKCNPPRCENDVVTGTAVALFDVVAAFFAQGSASVSKLGTSAEIQAAVKGLTRTALVAPVTFTHSFGDAKHVPLVTPPPPASS